MKKTPHGERKFTGKRVRFGVIGVGGMGSAHCRTIRKIRGARLTAVCDADAARALEVGTEMNVPFFTSHADFIRSGICDAVMIATPHPAHAEVAIACMNAGLHVVTEKPLSERVSTAEAMIRAARRNRVAFAVMFQRRFEPVFQKAMKIAKSGQLGRIYRTVMISPEYRSQSYYDSGSWRATWRGEGGGVMMNQAPHIMDLFVQLCGMPSEVYGRIETRTHRIEVEDLAEALLKYPDGGTGYLYCSTNEPSPGQMIEVFGEKGKLTYRDGQLRFTAYKPGVREHIRTCDEMWGAPEATEVPLRIPQKPYGHVEMLRNMTRHLLCGEALVTPGDSALASLELANAITLSAHEGRWVKLPISRSRYDEFLAMKRRTSGGKKAVAADKRVTDPAHVK